MFYKLFLHVQGFFSEFPLAFSSYTLEKKKTKQQNLQMFSTLSSCTQPQKFHLLCLLARMQQKADFSPLLPRTCLITQSLFLFAHLFCIKL